LLLSSNVTNEVPAVYIFQKSRAGHIWNFGGTVVSNGYSMYVCMCFVLFLALNSMGIPSGNTLNNNWCTQAIKWLINDIDGWQMIPHTPQSALCSF